MKTNLVTPAGWNTLDRELKYLWKEKRPQVTRAVSEAAALGDRSENAEYKEGKRELRAIDRRLRFLMKRLEELQIVHYAPSQEGKVYFGAFVELENEQEQTATYRIVGPDEIDVENNHITIDSPMARALIGKEVDDEVLVKTPSGDHLWFINKIYYQRS
ncbi:transcription elongation factor GreB [Psychrobium sp. 1_MG-2023]|uniref:transcription elongation factor GreB n=1 Tax=Psychrobium sp. 1_MG-2023 TaxID=3062624 RepID=UPI002690773F|nr:transcription elongation factor GreB [Psychrobium sp. 1_MG-2023]MDP2562607.1 transcription elongation factor GreB [Psychrobium sp. 1_MG-2023]